MTGTLSIDGTWGPWAGGTERVFNRDAITAIGKLRRDGDNRIHLVVRLADGAEIFVNASNQSAQDGRWLYKTGQGLQPGHDVVAWKAVQP